MSVFFLFFAALREVLRKCHRWITFGQAERKLHFYDFSRTFQRWALTQNWSLDREKFSASYRLRHLRWRCDVPNFQSAAGPITCSTNVYIMSRNTGNIKNGRFDEIFSSSAIIVFIQTSYHVSEKTVDLRASIFSLLMNVLILVGIVPSHFINFTWLHKSLIIAIITARENARKYKALKNSTLCF